MHLKEVFEFVDAFVGERQNAVVAEAINPDEAVLGRKRGFSPTFPLLT